MRMCYGMLGVFECVLQCVLQSVLQCVLQCVRCAAVCAIDIWHTYERVMQ